MNFRILLFSSLLILFSCEKENSLQEDNDLEYSSEVIFDNAKWLFPGEDISCVDFDFASNAWIGSDSDLIFYDCIDTQKFHAQSEILDLSVAPNGNIWLGTRETGLAKFSNNSFTYYTVENSNLPRNYVHNVDVDSNGKVWFCSASSKVGGVMNYNGSKFELFTPDNSILNQRVIRSLKIDKYDNIYFYTFGTVSNAVVYRINSTGTWEELGNDMKFYWLMSLDISSDLTVFVNTDHSLSSCFNCATNKIYYFNEENWNVLETPFEISSLAVLFVDKRDYIWMSHLEGNFLNFKVFDGTEWHYSEDGQIPQMFINNVKVDNENNIWFCTNDGIFILNQN